MSSEVTVSVKGEERTYKQKFLIYDEYQMSEDDPVIKACIDEARSNAKIEPEDIKVRSLLVVS